MHAKFLMRIPAMQGRRDCGQFYIQETLECERHIKPMY